MGTDMEQAPRPQRGVVAPQKARFWIKRRSESLQSRSPIQKRGRNSSKVDPKTCSMKMALPIGVLVCLVLLSMGLTTYAIAFDAELEKGSNDMEEKVSTIQSRSDYPDYDDLSSFFDFEIGPPSITYQHLDDSNTKKTFNPRPKLNKHYYHYDSQDYAKYKNRHYNVSPTKKQLVTPGTHYKSSTEKTFIEGESPINESKSVLNQANVGQYQVSIVDADSPLLSSLGLTQEDLEKLSGYNKRSVNNATMLASDSTQDATYAENPKPNYPPSGYPPSQNAPSYQPPYDPSNYSPQRSSYGETPYKRNEHHSSETQHSQGGYSHGATSGHPPPQGSYDPKSYRAVQGSNSQSSNTYNYPPPPPPPPSSYHPHSPPSTSYNNHQASPASYNPQPTPYSPQRSSGEPWRQTSQVHTDWDDKQYKKETNQESGIYPPHPPPLPYSPTSSNSGNYYPKPAYGSTPDKNGYRQSASYSKPESSSKSTYGSSAASGSTEYSSHKPSYYPSTSHSASKVPARAGSISYAASSHHHEPAPGKPGFTIRFKAKAPGAHGLSIPLSFSPLDVVKKLLPSLNPLNNKKVTIGITIENKKHEHPEYHPY